MTTRREKEEVCLIISDSVTAGYEWTCPDCVEQRRESLRHYIIKARKTVMCPYSKRRFQVYGTVPIVTTPSHGCTGSERRWYIMSERGSPS